MIINLLAKLYHKQQAKVRVAGTISKGFRVKKEYGRVVYFLHTSSYAC